MDDPTDKLHIHISNTKSPIIIHGGYAIGRLTSLNLIADINDTLIDTFYRVAGTFPIKQAIPNEVWDKKIYPLKISFGMSTISGNVTYGQKRIEGIKKVYIYLEVDKKPTIRLTLYENDSYRNCIEGLLDLGVELEIKKDLRK
jgi:hypothetical protein